MIFNQAHYDRLNRRLDHHSHHLDNILRRRPDNSSQGASFDMQLGEVNRALACFEEQIAAYARATLGNVVALATRAERADTLVEARLSELHEVAASAA